MSDGVLGEPTREYFTCHEPHKGEGGLRAGTLRAYIHRLGMSREKFFEHYDSL